jgi:alpha-tubulin suppressor-like RCC1 family protein
MQMIMGTHATLRKVAVIVAAGLCLGAMPAFLVAGPASAQGPNGTVDHWGNGVPSPEAVYLPGQVAQVGSSNAAYYALLTNGTLYAWGYNSRGELGDGNTLNSFTPVQVHFPGDVRIASIPTDADPFDTAYAIDTNGNVWGWGANAGGELCMNNAQTYLTPVQISSLSDVTAVAGAAQHATYDAGGTLYSCGVNAAGQLGDGSRKPSHVPVPVQGLGGAQVSAVVAGYNDVGVLLSNGQYYDWGWNSRGQLGDGTEGGYSEVPVHVTLPGFVTQAVEGGNGPSDGQTLVMLSDGSLYAWGVNSNGQLGTGNVTTKLSPVQIFPPSGVTYQVLAAGGATSYAVSTAGDVYGWGSNSAGQLGIGAKGGDSTTPVKILSNAAPLISSTSTDVAVALQNSFGSRASR